MNEEQYRETCSICEQRALKEKGIHIYNIFICESCEREIVSSDVGDPFYKYYLQKLRKLKQSLLNIS
ncbi:sigma factor G inhibitor Gin [Bacillaceae bacterium IKA-2]|nr:sigma factor G inhibitor Gin [Bacillaceae bacterium IKA-2]